MKMIIFLYIIQDMVCFRCKASETAYWQPIDAEMNRPGSWINEYELKAELKAIKAKHVMILADSCFSGALLRGINTGDFKKLSKKYN